MSVNFAAFGAGFNVDQSAVGPGQSRAAANLVGKTVTVLDPNNNVIVDEGQVTSVRQSPNNSKTKLITLTKTLDGVDASGAGLKYRITR
jgi:hypothetical protein